MLIKTGLTKPSLSQAAIRRPQLVKSWQPERFEAGVAMAGQKNWQRGGMMDNEEDMFQEHRLAGAGAAGLLTQRLGRISRGEGGSRSMRGGKRSRSRSRVVRGAAVGVRGAVATVAPWTSWLGGRYRQVTGRGWSHRTAHYMLYN